MSRSRRAHSRRTPRPARLLLGALLAACGALGAVGPAHAQPGAEPAPSDAETAPSDAAAFPQAEAVACAERLSEGGGARAPNAGGGPGPAEPRLGDVCAGLAAQIDAGPWGRSLAPGRAADLGARPFQELVDLAERYQRNAGPPDRLDPDELAAVVDSLGPFEPLARLSIWERLIRWLEARLGLDDADGPGGLAAWLRRLSLPEPWSRVIVYALGALVVLAAALVAANELRVGGAFRGRRRDAPAAATARAGRRAGPASGLDTLRGAPPERQPVLLLGLLVERLRRRFDGAFGHSATHREVAAAAAARGIVRRRELESVVGAAERVTFADWRPGTEEVAPVLAAGQAVLEELDGAANGFGAAQADAGTTRGPADAGAADRVTGP